jgi:DtxR family Mn-dependent transcriptional regulator
MHTERTEEYLETIQGLINRTSSPAKNKDIAKELDLAPATVTEMIQRLSDEGLVTHAPYRGIELTESGMIQANNLQRKHLVLKNFFTRVLDISEKVADQEACALEHVMSDVVLERMCSYLAEKGLCDISETSLPSKCSLSREHYIPLVEMNEKARGKVVMVALPKETKDRLTSLGMVAGEDIEIKRKQKQGCISIITKGTEIALGNEVAEKIFVKPAENDHRQRRRGNHS